MSDGGGYEIYLDVDGVCADLIRPGLRAIDLDPDMTLASWRAEHSGEFYPQALLGMPAEEFFLRLDRLGARFWSELEPYPWFPDFYHRLGEFGHVMFLTATTGFPDCLAGKYQWLIRHFGERFVDCIFTQHKERLAHERAVLIDDSDENIRRFRARGGIGLLFPRFWNSAGDCEAPDEAVITQLRALPTNS